MVTFTVHFLTKDVPMTLDSSRLYFTGGLTVAILVIVATGVGVVLARAREPVFGAVIKGD